MPPATQRKRATTRVVGPVGPRQRHGSGRASEEPEKTSLSTNEPVPGSTSHGVCPPPRRSSRAFPQHEAGCLAAQAGNVHDGAVTAERPHSKSARALVYSPFPEGRGLGRRGSPIRANPLTPPSPMGRGSRANPPHGKIRSSTIAKLALLAAAGAGERDDLAPGEGGSCASALVGDPNRRSRRLISAQTSFGWIPLAT